MITYEQAVLSVLHDFGMKSICADDVKAIEEIFKRKYGKKHDKELHHQWRLISLSLYRSLHFKVVEHRRTYSVKSQRYFSHPVYAPKKDNRQIDLERLDMIIKTMPDSFSAAMVRERCRFYSIKAPYPIKKLLMERYDLDHHSGQYHRPDRKKSKWDHVSTLPRIDK